MVARADGTEVPLFRFENREDFDAATTACHPGVIYEWNGMQYEIDEEGRPVRVSGTITPQSVGRGDRSTSRQRRFRREYGDEWVPTDVVFHIIGVHIGGPTNNANLVPGNGVRFDEIPNLNQGAWKVMENTIAHEVRVRGNPVTITIQIHYGESGSRPTGFTAVIVYADGTTTTEYYPNRAPAEYGPNE